MAALVVAAMGSELRAFTRRWRGEGVTTGVLGVGTRSARRSTEQLVARDRPDRVVVIGVAGGIGPTTSIGSLVVPAVVLDAATGSTYEPAPVPGRDGAGTLRTSDRLVVEPGEIAALVARGVVALDMETAAVAAVCEAAGVPWSVLRGISDHADAERIDPAVLGLLDPSGAPRPRAVARYVLGSPGRIPHLVRLGRGLSAAANASAAAAVAFLRGAPPGR